jgi:hypothetical protein
MMGLDNVPSLFILKAMIAKELQRTGDINVMEFPNLIAKVMQYTHAVNYPNNANNYMIYLLDIIAIDGDKVTLSEDGIRYLRAFEILINDITKLP